MTPKETAALTERRSRDERVLIYRNLLIGVHMLQIMKEFRKSEKEIMDIFRLVSERIGAYCFVRKLPPIYCDCVAVAQKFKESILPLLVRINLDKPSPIRRMTHEKFSGGVPGDAMVDVLREMRR